MDTSVTLGGVSIVTGGVLLVSGLVLLASSPASSSSRQSDASQQARLRFAPSLEVARGSALLGAAGEF